MTDGSRTKVLVVVGTRPEAIKLASTIRYLREQVSSELSVVACATGQHTDLLDLALRDFDLKLDEVAPPIPGGRQLPDLLSAVLAAVADQIRRHRPAAVIVHGDTTSALGGALAAFHLGIPCCHIEAGLRSYRQWEPFPEEMNRRLLSKLASFHFATSQPARANLIQEGVEAVRIFPIQNPLVDALAFVSSKLDLLNIGTEAPTASNILLTLHRREDRAQRFQSLAQAIARIDALHGPYQYDLVWHPSLTVDEHLLEPLRELPNFNVLPPLGYADFIQRLFTSRLVITDSAGVSEEAAILGVPAVVFRRVTERQDLIDAGMCVPVGVHLDGLLEGVSLALREPFSRTQQLTESHVARTIGRTLIDLVAPTLGDIEMGDLR